MLILALSVIASPEGKDYLELSSNVKKEEKVNKETVTLGLISIFCWSQQKETGIRSLCSKNMRNSATGEFQRPLRF